MKTLMVLAAIGLVASTLPASAATVFTTRAAFNAAAGATTVETFDNVTGSVSSVVTAGFTVAGLDPTYRNGFYDVPAIGSRPGNVPVVFTFNQATSVFATDIFDLGTFNPTTITVALNNGETFALISNYNNAAQSVFRGFTTTSSFTTLTLTSNGQSGDYAEFDNVAFNSAVPESATWAMMLVGFAAVGHTVRRRKTSGYAMTRA